mmetsp:Transcript_19055/g.57578  ORF Transcript_19055/g.57578 Transcript_19055/m.57578 type:complete len:408 (+) Transcript_19055:291-1514(+)
MLTGANANLAQHLASRPATAFRVPCSIQLQQKPARASFYGTKRSQRPRLAHNDDVQKQSFARAVGKGLSCRTTDVALPIRTRPARRQCIVRAASSAASPGTSPAQAAPESAKPPYYLHSWRWRGHKINYAVAGCGPPVVLVHGFGASVGHWRKNIPELAKSHQVLAIDLLGQGASDKPLLEDGYSMELWGELLSDFLAEFTSGSKPVLVGNSVGSLACLLANSKLPEGGLAGTILINCAGGLNNKAVVDDWRLKLAAPLFWLIDFLLNQPPVARYLFDRFRTRENLRQVLLNVYTDPAAVDDALVELLYGPSCSEGALETFVSIITGPPGPPPSSLMADVKGPLLVLWGDKDVFTPIDGPVGKMFAALPQTRPNTTFQSLPGENHCVHDDNPALVNGVIMKWLDQLR